MLRINGLQRIASIRPFTEPFQNVSNQFKIASAPSAAPRLKPLRIGVTLADLTPKGVHQPDMFDTPQAAELTSAIDKVNSRFGKGTITFGAQAEPMTSKIAFQRIPKLDEF